MPASDYARIERAIGYLETHAREQPELRAIARHVGLSEFHFQRLFRRWAGVSPKRFLQFLTADYARRLLERSHTVHSRTTAAVLTSRVSSSVPMKDAHWASSECASARPSLGRR